MCVFQAREGEQAGALEAFIEHGGNSAMLFKLEELILRYLLFYVIVRKDK